MFSKFGRLLDFLTHFVEDLVSTEAHLCKVGLDVAFMIFDFAEGYQPRCFRGHEIESSSPELDLELFGASDLTGSHTFLPVRDWIICPRIDAVEVIFYKGIVVLFGMTGFGKLTPTRVVDDRRILLEFQKRFCQNLKFKFTNKL